MLVKIYWSLWAIFVAASIVLFAAGDFTSLVAVVLGFIAFGLTFMGMMGVLPTIVSHSAPEKPVKARSISVEPRRESRAVEPFGRLKSA